MSGENDLIKLYSGRILALAAEIPHTNRLAAPQATVKKRSPLCGSTVTVDVVLENGRITDFAQDVKACALGQASASVVGANVVGCSRDQIEAARDALKAMLKEDGPSPNGKWSDLQVLMPVRDFKARHASTLLTFDAVCDAVRQAQGEGAEIPAAG